MNLTAVILAVSMALALTFLTPTALQAAPAGPTVLSKKNWEPSPDHNRPDRYHCNISTCRGKGKRCCEHKCIEVRSDRHNCGVCGHKYRYNESCCGGLCVNLSFHRRHCGACNRACRLNRRCIYGMCGYA